MRIELNGRSGYEAVESVVLFYYGQTGQSIVVELQTRGCGEWVWKHFSALLLNDGDDWNHPRYVWEYDWWEGEPDIQLIAAAPVCDVVLPNRWRL